MQSRWACSRSSSGAASAPTASSAPRSAPSTVAPTPGNPTLEGIERMATVWLQVKGTDIFPRGTFDGPWAFFQKRAAVHANAGLRAIIEAGIDYENLEDAAIPIEVVTTSLTDGRERWITHGPAVEAILASSAIPSIFPPVTIDGDVLVDGGVVNNVPITRALAEGCDRIYVLLCGPLHYHPRPPRRPAEAALTAFFVAVHARFVRSWLCCRPARRSWCSAAAAIRQGSTVTSRPPRHSSRRAGPRSPTSSTAMRGRRRSWPPLLCQPARDWERLPPLE